MGSAILFGHKRVFGSKALGHLILVISSCITPTFFGASLCVCVCVCVCVYVCVCECGCVCVCVYLHVHEHVLG